MTVMEAPVIERVDEFVPDQDPDKEAHIVFPAHAITEASVLGIPVTALCGHTWIPSRATDQFPVCQRCIEVYEALRGKPWHGRR